MHRSIRGSLLVVWLKILNGTDKLFPRLDLNLITQTSANSSRLSLSTAKETFPRLSSYCERNMSQIATPSDNADEGSSEKHVRWVNDIFTWLDLVKLFLDVVFKLLFPRLMQF